MSHLPELSQGALPAKTPWSTVLAAAGSGEQARAALETLSRTYWLPVYMVVRRERSPEDALDLTQQIFLDLFRRDLPKVDRNVGSFRAYLFTVLASALSNDAQFRRRARRDERMLVWIDGMIGEERCRLEPLADVDIERAFDRAWVSCVGRQVIEELRAEHEARGEGDFFRLAAPLLLDGDAEVGAEGQSELAARLGSSPVAFRSRLSRLRIRRLERICRKLNETVESPKQLDEELGVLRASWR
jgi:DNA-directed RNA polymerase specialized sigma24 family protein